MDFGFFFSRKDIMLEVIINKFDKVVVLDEEEKDILIKGLRMLLLVGNDNETMAVAKLLDLLLAE